MGVINKGIQGDAHLIQIKDFGAILIDTGYLEQTNKTLIPFLKRNQINHLKKVFI